ncbi:MAG: hypothetical protein MZV49_15225 [Rhodopseudomonas palustris]|nr:hypothetical protein [Rhodopseudomonas palustris]
MKTLHRRADGRGRWRRRARTGAPMLAPRQLRPAPAARPGARTRATPPG